VGDVGGRGSAATCHRTPAVYVIEDAHWIDEVSESMLAEFLTVIPQTQSLVLVTYRPEYRGVLSQVQGAQTIALAPLSDSETGALVSQLLGLHMVGAIAAAAHIGLSLGLTVAQIEAGIRNTKPFEHRLELRNDSGVVTLDDSYNGNPDGVRAVIDFLASLPGRRWYVTPGLVEMGGKAEAIHRDIGAQLVRAGIEKVVLMRNSVTPYIEAGLKDAGFKGELIWFDDAPAGYAALRQITASGDIVLMQNDWPDQYA